MSARLILMTKRLFLSWLLISSAHAQWEALPSLPEPNGGAFCGPAEGKIVVVGGTNWEGGKKNWLRSVHAFDPASKKWSTLPALRDGPVAYGVTLPQAASFQFLGGSDGVRSLKAVGTVNAAGAKLQEVPELPSSIVLGSGGVVDGSLIIVGGTDDAANVSSVSRLTYSITLTDGTWKVRPLSAFPGKAFMSAGSAATNGELLVFGGLNWNENTKTIENTTSAHAFSPAKNAWRVLKSLEVANRGLSAVALDDQRIYLAGGFRDDFTADAVIYDVKTDSYREAKPLPYAAMVALVKCEGFVYCIGGEDKMKSRTDKFFRIPVAELLK
jgi:N-acetylneuraminic acid mutarotase